MSNFYASIPTQKHLQREAAQLAGGPKIVYTTLVVGDGDGAVPALSDQGIGLVHEVWRGPINRVSINPKNPKQVDVEVIIPAADANGVEIGPFTIREAMLLDEQGNQVVAVITQIEKTTGVANNQPLALRWVISIGVSNTNAVTFYVPADAYATSADVLSIEAAIAQLVRGLAISAQDLAEQRMVNFSQKSQLDAATRALVDFRAL